MQEIAHADDKPTFLFNKNTNEIIMLEETETLGVRISRYRHDRVLYEDNNTTTETVNKFLDMMYELEDQGFQDVTEL